MKKSDECVQLKNINYQTMLLNRNSTIDTNKNECNNIDQFLINEKEKIGGGKLSWNRLEKIIKIKKINEYADVFCKKEKIPDNMKKKLKEYLRLCLERKKLQRIKDVNYDSKEGKITKIPGLAYNNNKFTLRRIDKKNSISKNLAPKTKKRKKQKKGKKTGKVRSNKNKSNRKKSPLNKTNKKRGRKNTKNTD